MHSLLASRLIKYTGYGNAAGLLMTHGLLAGGVSEVDSIYSSDEDSDTDEYTESQAKYVDKDDCLYVLVNVLELTQ